VVTLARLSLEQLMRAFIYGVLSLNISGNNIELVAYTQPLRQHRQTAQVISPTPSHNGRSFAHVSRALPHTETLKPQSYRRLPNNTDRLETLSPQSI